MIDINTVQELLITASWVVPIIAGLVQVIKSAVPAIDGRFTPLLSVVVGLGLGISVVGLTVTGGFVGVVFGLTASGLYDLGKKTIAGA
jgi:hypothetical protein